MLFTDGVISRDAFDNFMYIHTIKALTMKHDQRDYGTPSGARTLDTLIKSQVLYQLS